MLIFCWLIFKNVSLSFILIRFYKFVLIFIFTFFVWEAPDNSGAFYFSDYNVYILRMSRVCTYGFAERRAYQRCIGMHF